MSTSYIVTQGAAATTIRKNSGILRYNFGDGSGSGAAVGAVQTVLNSSLTGGNTYVCWCLGDDADVTPDSDGQVFGNTVGYGLVTPAAGSLFTGKNIGTARAVAPIGIGAGIRFPPNNPNAGAATGQARLQANGRIPAGTKVYAWFQMYEQITGASTVSGEQPLALVQTEVLQNGIMTVAGTVDNSSQQQYVTSIRVAVSNVGAASTGMGGVLYVRLEHSFEDLPGLAPQSVQPFLTPS